MVGEAINGRRPADIPFKEHIDQQQCSNKKAQVYLLISYNTMLMRLEKLAREKGNLAEIIRLTE